MPILNCTVVNCHFNEDNLCCLEGIKVEGKHADTSEDTACGSFEGRARDRYTSAVEKYGYPEKKSDIDCKAVQCNYNDDCKCRAKEIQVSGKNASDSRETECSTFIEK